MPLGLLNTNTKNLSLASEEPSHTQARPVGRVFVLMIVLTVVVADYLLWLLVAAPGPALTERIGDGLFVLLGAAAVGMAWRAATGSSHPQARRAWQLVSLAYLVYTAGTVAWFVFRAHGRPTFSVRGRCRLPRLLPTVARRFAHLPPNPAHPRRAPALGRRPPYSDTGWGASSLMGSRRPAAPVSRAVTPGR
jgi:hypothetical protein